MPDVNTLLNQVRSVFPQLVEIRRHLHRHPELSFQEFQTSVYIRKILTQHNIRFTDGWVNTGIVAEIGQVGSANCIALRGDMDALPILEQNTHSYKSVNEGIMHACGHDVHTTCLLGAAIVLKQMEAELNGCVRLIFQPGEEKLPGGASLMIKEGALGNPLPKAIIGLHVFPEMETGSLGFRKGEYMASSDEIYLTVEGKGGHAAMRGQYNNPLIIAAEVLLALEKFFGEEHTRKFTSKPTVLAFGRIEGKGATNVIPDTVSIEGTFRAFDEPWRAQAHEAIREIAGETATKLGGKVQVNIVKGYPALNNHEGLTELCSKAAAELLGESHIKELALRMTAEDFAWYSQLMPACFYRLGTRNEARNIISPVHTATFDIDENALVTGAASMAWLGLNALDHFRQVKEQ
jgi:amidohydrolase